MADNTQQDAARQAAEAVQASGRATSEAARRGSEFAAGATRRIGEAGAEALNRSGRVGSENIRRGTQNLAESQQQIVQNAAEHPLFAAEAETRRQGGRSPRLAQGVQGYSRLLRLCDGGRNRHARFSLRAAQIQPDRHST